MKLESNVPRLVTSAITVAVNVLAYRSVIVMPPSTRCVHRRTTFPREPVSEHSMKRGSMGSERITPRSFIGSNTPDRHPKGSNFFSNTTVVASALAPKQSTRAGTPYTSGDNAVSVTMPQAL